MNRASGDDRQGDADALWHKAEVDKSEPYVGELLLARLRKGPLDLRGAALIGIRLGDADLSGIDLRGADLRDAQLPGAVLRGSCLADANLRRANLIGADLVGADLSGADLSGAHLGNARLVDTDLRRCHIEDTVLLGADLEGAALDEALIVSFTWNRLTRFAGIRSGSEAAGGDDDATRQFATPLALGDQDLSSGERQAISGTTGSGLTQTRNYRSDVIAREQSPTRVGTASTSPEEPETPRRPTTPTAPTAQPTTVADRRPPLLLAVAGWALACAALGLAAWLWSTRTVSVLPDPTRLPTPPLALPTPSAVDDERERSYRRRIADLTAAMSREEQRVRGLQAQLTDLDTDHRELLLRKAWLENRLDGDARRRREIEQLRADLQQAAGHNRRLEETARILADGVKELAAEKTRLEDQVYQQVQDQHRLEELEQERRRLLATLAVTEEHLAQARTRNGRLEQDLAEADNHLATIERRLQGTGLGDLLVDEPEEAPLVAITPGRTITFGGDYLVSLRLDRVPDDEAFSTEIVLQAPSGTPIPEMNLLLYGEAGKPLRKLSLSFPDHRGSNGFATVRATISSPIFPSAARLVLAPGLGGAPAVADAVNR